MHCHRNSRARPGHRHWLHSQGHAMAKPQHDEVETEIGCGYPDEKRGGDRVSRRCPISKRQVSGDECSCTRVQERPTKKSFNAIMRCKSHMLAIYRQVRDAH